MAPSARPRPAEALAALARTTTGRFIAWLPALAMMGLILSLSNRSELGESRYFVLLAARWFGQEPWFDQAVPWLAFLDAARGWLAHPIEYGIFGVTLALAWSAQGVRPRQAWTLAWTTAVLFGALDETYQGFVPNRTPSLVDLAADGVGAGLGIALYARGLRPRLRRAIRGDST